jgi:predicted metal-dependent peptidase
MLKYNEYNDYKKFLESRVVNATGSQSLLEAKAYLSDDDMSSDQLLAETKSKVELAISKIMIQFKFFGEFIYRLRIVYTYSVSTMATDGKNIFISPQFCKDLNTSEIMFILVHEVLHNVMTHFLREQNLLGGKPSPEQHGQWNIAADYEINLIAVDALTKKDGSPLLTVDYVKNKLKGCIDEKYMDMAAEVIYRMNPGAPNQFNEDEQYPANIGDYVRLKDGSFGQITSIDANGDYEIDPVDEETINQIFG